MVKVLPISSGKNCTAAKPAMFVTWCWTGMFRLVMRNKMMTAEMPKQKLLALAAARVLASPRVVR